MERTGDPEIREWAQRLAASAPPLTEAQKDAIRTAFRGVHPTAKEGAA